MRILLPDGCMGTYTPAYGDTPRRLCLRDDRECDYEGAYLNDCPRAHDTGADRLHDVLVDRELSNG